MKEPWSFHLSLNVSSLPRALEFYRTLFGMEPAKSQDDYAKFELFDPAVVFSLVPHKIGSEGSRSQAGLRLASAEQLKESRRRLESRGIHVQAFPDPEAGFSVADPDGNSSQLTVGDAAPSWAPVAKAAGEPASPPGQEIIWEHYVTAPFPDRIPHDDATVDEIRLTGSFNGPQKEDHQQRLLADAFRAMKPGGKVVVHALAADRPFPHGMPSLPGLAAMVSRVPLHQDIAAALRGAGLVGLQFIKFSDKAWFQHDGVEMREIKVLCWKPPSLTDFATSSVIYRGPFRQVRDDQGNTYVRGERVAVSAATFTMLRQGPHAEQFVFENPEKAGKACQFPQVTIDSEG